MSTVPAEIEALIKDQPPVAQPATSVNDRSYVAPIGCHYEDGKNLVEMIRKKSEEDFERILNFSIEIVVRGLVLDDDTGGA